MSDPLKTALESVKSLSVQERATLAHCLISSLDSTRDEGVDAAWATLAKKRFDEITAGTVETVSWKDIKQNIQS